MAFFTELEQVAKTILRKKNGARENHTPWLQTILKATVIKTVWY